MAKIENYREVGSCLNCKYYQIFDQEKSLRRCRYNSSQITIVFALCNLYEKQEVQSVMSCLTCGNMRTNQRPYDSKVCKLTEKVLDSYSLFICDSYIQQE